MSIHQLTGLPLSGVAGMPLLRGLPIVDRSRDLARPTNLAAGEQSTELDYPPADPIDAAHILLVTDQPIFRNGFAAMLNVLRPGWRLLGADNASDAARVATERAPDLVLVDAALAGDNANRLIAHLASDCARRPLLVISDREGHCVRERACVAGARGAICRTLMPENVIGLMEAALHGETQSSENHVHGLVLTERRQQVLNLLAKGFANKEIQFRLNLAERTVRAHLTDLFQQLGVHSRTQAVIRARELGLLD